MCESFPSLFTQITCNSEIIQKQTKQHLLRHIFTCHQQSVILTLYNNILTLQENNQNCGSYYYLQLGFNVKFQTVYQKIPHPSSPGIPTAITLQKENCKEKLTFVTTHPAIAQKWSLELQKRINQRNFHQLFKAKKKIGKGAFATVYLAERLRDHKMVAVKAFSKEKQYASDKGRQSLENEIKLMRKLDHVNISKLEGVYQTENSIYVILEYLQGKQLNQVLKNNTKIEISDAKQIIQNILKGLSHLDKQRIIHRDLKPENIIFREQNSCDLAICDFGLATYADEDRYLFVRCGTPGFVAPQIINIRDMSTKSEPISDVFSAGIIFHYMLFGRSIFQGKKYNEVLQQNRECHIKFDKEMYNNITYKAFDLLTKMLEKDPRKRITAEKALIHPFFIEMDIEYDHKSLSKSVPLTPSLFEDKDEIVSCTTGRRRDQKYFNLSKVSQDNEILKYL